MQVHELCWIYTISAVFDCMHSFTYRSLHMDLLLPRLVYYVADFLIVDVRFDI
jgi:hypothetical protein